MRSPSKLSTRDRHEVRVERIHHGTSSPTCLRGHHAIADRTGETGRANGHKCGDDGFPSSSIHLTDIEHEQTDAVQGVTNQWRHVEDFEFDRRHIVRDQEVHVLRRALRRHNVSKNSIPDGGLRFHLSLHSHRRSERKQGQHGNSDSVQSPQPTPPV